MAKKIRRIGVLTSGGDAPGMNAAVRAVVRTCMYLGIECIGIKRGWNGLIHGDFSLMTGKDVAHIINRGGTILYTARSEEFRTPEGRAKAYQTCQMLGLDGIVAIGGDGTFAGCRAFSREYPISVVGIPGTIDNDIGCSYYSLGYDTAANTAIEAIDKVRDTMQSHERCSVIEVMGHRAGNLAQYVGIATGATAVLVPEKPWDFEKDVASKLRDARVAGRTHFMIIVAEGAKMKQDGSMDNDVVGNGGAANQVAAMIKERVGLDPRVTILGHTQRGGAPNARDRVNASRMGYYAVKLLASGANNRIVRTWDGRVCDIDMEEGLKMKNVLSLEEQNVLEAMTGSYISKGPTRADEEAELLKEKLRKEIEDELRVELRAEIEAQVRAEMKA
ncbi:MAG: 6-phosphofructokinase, partial [Clostridiales bacterium]|nr:6-phosphofructokinase [Candidatus Blautia equi]